jgi:PHP family Zn ribbon phosphoesterase
MEETTCPNCNVDVDPKELRENQLRCPTCGYDMSEPEDEDDWDEDDDLEDEDEEEEEDEDEDDED